jgi:hypothetical protein
MQKMNKIVFLIVVLISACLSASEESELPRREKQPEFYHYCLPVSSRVERIIRLVTDEMKINVFEFFALRGMNFYSATTTKLIVDSDDNWRLEFTAVPDVAIVVLLTQNTLETTKGEDKRLVSEQEMAKRIIEAIRNADPAGKNLERIRRFESEIRKVSERIWGHEK